MTFGRSGVYQYNVIDFAILEADWRCCFRFIKYAAEGMSFGNSVYWVHFDEEFSDKVDLFSSRYTFLIFFFFGENYQ